MHLLQPIFFTKFQLIYHALDMQVSLMPASMHVDHAGVKLMSALKMQVGFFMGATYYIKAC